MVKAGPLCLALHSSNPVEHTSWKQYLKIMNEKAVSQAAVAEKTNKIAVCRFVMKDQRKRQSDLWWKIRDIDQKSRVEVRQAALLHPRKIRENLYQVHLVVVLIWNFATPSRQHQIDFTVGTRTISPTSASHVPTVAIFANRGSLSPDQSRARSGSAKSLARAAPCMTSHATVFFSRPLSLSFLASKTSCSTRVT